MAKLSKDEEFILLSIWKLKDNAYGITIRRDFMETTNQTLHFGSLYNSLELLIRKVLGASMSGIFMFLSRGLLKWVLLANIIAWPVAYYFMDKWLQNFAYRIGLSVWIFLLAGLAAFGIALLTVSYQSIKAATANPVDSLRYE